MSELPECIRGRDYLSLSNAAGHKVAIARSPIAEDDEIGYYAGMRELGFLDGERLRAPNDLDDEGAMP